MVKLQNFVLVWHPRSLDLHPLVPLTLLSFPFNTSTVLVINITHLILYFFCPPLAEGGPFWTHLNKITLFGDLQKVQFCFRHASGLFEIAQKRLGVGQRKNWWWSTTPFENISWVQKGPPSARGATKNSKLNVPNLWPALYIKPVRYVVAYM